MGALQRGGLSPAALVVGSFSFLDCGLAEAAPRDSGFADSKSRHRAATAALRASR
jgi:hypothetical protein